MKNEVKQYQQSAICDTDYTDDYMVIARHAEMKKHSLYNAYLLDIAKSKNYSTKLTESYLTSLANCQKDMTTVVDKKMGTYYHTYGFRCRRNFCWGCTDKRTNIMYRNILKAIDEYLFNNPSSQFNIYMSTFSLDYVQTMEEAIVSLKCLNTYMKLLSKKYSNSTYVQRSIGRTLEKRNKRSCNTLLKMIHDDLGLIVSLELSYNPSRGFKPHMHINVITDINTHITGQEMDDLFMYVSKLKQGEFYSFTEETHADKLDFDFAKQIALISSYTMKGFLIDFQKTGMSTDEQAKSAGLLFDFLFKKTTTVVAGKIFSGQRIRSKQMNTTGRHEHKLLNQIGIRENGLNEDEYDDIVKEFEGKPVQKNDITDNVSIDESGVLPKKEDLKNDKFLSVNQAAKKYASKLNINKTINIPKKQTPAILNTYTKEKIKYEQQVLWNFDDDKLSFIMRTSKNDLNRVLSMRILKVKNMCRDFAEKQKKILNEKHPMLFEHIVERAKVSYMKDKIMKHFHMDVCIKYVYNPYENVYLKSSKVDYAENDMILKSVYYNTFVSHDEYKQKKNEWLENHNYEMPTGYFCRSSKHTKMSNRFIRNK